MSTPRPSAPRLDPCAVSLLKAGTCADVLGSTPDNPGTRQHTVLGAERRSDSWTRADGAQGTEGLQESGQAYA